MTAPSSLTDEQVAAWKADAERVSLSSCCILAGQEGHRAGEHRAFYDDRILALIADRARLTERLAEVEARAEALAAANERLHSLALTEGRDSALRQAVTALAAEWIAADGEPVSSEGLAILCTVNRKGHELRALLAEHATPSDRHPCGDYPAPCNCDDPETHNGH